MSVPFRIRPLHERAFATKVSKTEDEKSNEVDIEYVIDEDTGEITELKPKNTKNASNGIKKQESVVVNTKKSSGNVGMVMRKNVNSNVSYM